MENGRKLLRGIALAAIAVIGLGGIALFASPSLAAQTRPDVIRIDAIGQLKKLEMPPAVFLHDEHTKALAATGQDCSVCHTPTANGHTVKFQRKEDGTDAKKLENIYHNGCIGCHENMASNDQKTGPLDGECRACHDTKLPFKAEQKPVKMGSKSLHYLHVSSKAIVNPANSEENCGVCHHVYDEKLNKLVWKKGQEDACAACHGEKAVGSTPSLQTAVHTKCVWCHENVAQSSRAYLTAQVEAKKAAEEAAASGTEQPKENKVTKIASGFLGVVVLIALAAGGIFYAFAKQKQKKQAEKEALDPDANYTEDKGDFEIPTDVPDEDETPDEQDTEPI